MTTDTAFRPSTAGRTEPHSPLGRSTRRISAAVRRRRVGLPSWVLLTQLFIGLGWLRAAAEKIIDPAWWSGEALARFLIDHDGAALGWYQPFLDGVVRPHLVVIAVVVVGAQLVAAGSLISGRVHAVGLATGVFLNLNFLAAGAVNPSAFYLVSQGGLALWLAERTRNRSTARPLTVAAIGASVLALISLPFVDTIEPARVIDDPALMMATGGLLTVIACDSACRNLTGGHGLAVGRRRFAE